MKLILDGKAGEWTNTSCTLKDVLEELQKNQIPQHLVVREVFVDGEEVSLEASFLSTRSVSSVSELTVTTANPRELTIEGTISTLTILPRLSEAVRECASLLQTGGETEAMQRMSEIVDVIKWFNIILEGLEKVVGVNLSLFHDGQQSLLEKRKQLAEILKGTFGHFEAGDWVRLSDLLEHELAPHLSSWLACMPEVIKEIERKTS